ncbi:MAG: hypothetical protein Q8L87_20425 [Anaerolineales bacterium]|nr:hypothetical protein [Anaerolineales bacterium]
MNLNDLISPIVLSIVSGLLSYFAATSKANKDLIQLREQNKLEIERLMNQHKMDLEAQKQKHQMEVEKMELEHKHKLELAQKETENKLGSDMMSQVISEMMKTPEVKRELLRGMQKKK